MQDEQQGTTAAKEMNILFEHIKKGSATERAYALDHLHQRARGSNDPEHWNYFALGLWTAGRFGEAIQIFNTLVESFPQIDKYRMNLATAYRGVGQFEMCKYHLGYLAEHGSTKDERMLGREQLESLERSLKQTEQERQLRRLQVDSLRERIASGQTSADDYERLGRLLIEMERQGFEGVSLNEITDLLEEGQKRFPRAVAILELLAFCYSVYDPMHRLESMLKKLEREAPDSRALQAFNIDNAAIEEYAQQRQQHTLDLLKQALSKDTELRMAAVRELRKIVDRRPSNRENRLIYAFALSFAGQYPEAIQQAELVANEADNSHAVHFNLGQIFWTCGDRVRARQHLNLSLKYARNDEERKDAMECDFTSVLVKYEV